MYKVKKDGSVETDYDPTQYETKKAIRRQEKAKTLTINSSWLEDMEKKNKEVCYG
jgi:hypothetical protein